MSMTKSEMRFSILKTADYDKAAAEIMVGFISDDETKYNLFNTAFNATQNTNQNITERVSTAKDAAVLMYGFTGSDADKYQLFSECFQRTTQGADVTSRTNAAIDEADKLLSIISAK